MAEPGALTAVIAALFWAAVAALVWAYVLYPFVVLVWGRIRPLTPVAQSSDPSSVTVAIAVHNGATQVEQRIVDIFENAAMPIEIVVASDGSTDETAATVRGLADADPRVRLLDLPRVGQSGAQAEIFASATGDIVVLTDIETLFEPGCLAALIAPFEDPRVGCVTGVLRWHYDLRTHTARDEGLYWRYEQRVRAWESRAGWLTAGTGALLAVRRSVYRPAPAHASLDQMLPLYAAELGLVTVVARGAVGTDRGAASVAEQRASRTRIATQGIEANLRMSLRIRPWRNPGAFVAIWSHKLLRWATPILAAMSIATGLYVFAVTGAVLYLAPTVGAVTVAGLAVLGSGFARTIINVNAAFARAWVNVALRRRVASWESG